MPKIYTYRELRKLLKEYGIYEDSGRGKGSHRMFFKGDNGFPVKCHNEGDDVAVHYIKGLERTFKIEIPR